MCKIRDVATTVIALFIVLLSFSGCGKGESPNASGVLTQYREYFRDAIQQNAFYEFCSAYTAGDALSADELFVHIAERREKRARRVVEKQLYQYKKQKTSYLLLEDIVLNDVPDGMSFPFASDPNEDYLFPDASAEAEWVYLPNLQLKYSPRVLRKEDDSVWVSPGKDITQSDTYSPSFKCAGAIDSLRHNWNFDLPADNAHLAYGDRRQWFRGFAENSLVPVLNRAYVVMRNEYAIYIIDTVSGELVTTFHSDPRSYQETIQHYRHPHINSEGYELLVHDDVVYTELDGGFVAVDISDALRPRQLWRVPLGAYTAIAAPVYGNGQILLSVVTARGEVWMLGFDAQRGTLTWHTYIGRSSFVAPVASLHRMYGKNALIATSHGVLICINTIDGQIQWVHRYDRKDYSLVEYWEEALYDDVFAREGYEAYDTELLEISSSGTVYFKSRESDYLSIIDIVTGKTRSQIPFDERLYQLISIDNDTLVFIVHGATEKDDKALYVLEKETGAFKKKIDLEGGALRGVERYSEETVLFKIGRSLFSYDVKACTVTQSASDCDPESWLIASGENVCYLGSGLRLTQLSTNKKDNGSVLLENQRAVLRRLEHLFSAPESTLSVHEQARLVQDIVALRINATTLFPYVTGLHARDLSAQSKDMLRVLSGLYASDVITYNGIQLLFINYCKGLLGELPVVQDKTEVHENIPGSNRGEVHRDWMVQGKNMVVVPIETSSGESFSDAYLVIRDRQCMYVRESGELVWARPIFFFPINSRYYSQKSLGRLYGEEVDAVVCGDVIILNDQVNVIALNRESGEYLWSSTVSEKELAAEKKYPLDGYDQYLNKKSSPFFQKYGVRASFVQNLMSRIFFHESKLYLIRKNSLFRIDPKTGYCEKKSRLDIRDILSVYDTEDGFFMMPFANDGLYKVGYDGTVEQRIDTSMIDDSDYYPQLFISDERIVLVTREYVALFDKESGHHIATDAVEGVARSWIEYVDDRLIVITPYKQIRSYGLGDDRCTLEWEYLFPQSEEVERFSFRTFYAKYYAMNDNKLIIPQTRNETLFMYTIDLRDGTCVSESEVMSGVGSLFSLSNMIQNDSELRFILSTIKDSDAALALSENFNYMNPSSAWYIETTRITYDTIESRMISSRELPGYCTFYREVNTIIELPHAYIYGLHDHYVISAEKEKTIGTDSH